MTDHPTTPAPPPVHSTLPPYADMAAQGEILLALDMIAKHLGDKLRGDFAEVANLLSKAMHRKQAECEAVSDARWERLERSIARTEANQNLLLDHFRTLTERMNLLEGQHARNHTVALSVPPSTRDHDTEAKEA